MTEQQVRDMFVSRGAEGVLLQLAYELAALVASLEPKDEPTEPVTPVETTEDK